MLETVTTVWCVRNVRPSGMDDQRSDAADITEDGGLHSGVIPVGYYCVLSGVWGLLGWMFSCRSSKFAALLIHKESSCQCHHEL
jgi:hypothetical protein